MADRNILAGLRVGFGFHVRRFEQGAPLFIAGSAIAHEAGLGQGLEGDIVCRSVAEALLSAAGLPGFDSLFNEPGDELVTAEPLVALSQVATALLRKQLAEVLNLSVQIAIIEPELASYHESMLLQLADALHIEPSRVAIKVSQTSQFEGVVAGDSAVAFANLLCVLRDTDARQPTAARQTHVIESPALKAQQDEPQEDDEHLPERAKKFEKAVKTKLPPLPVAPPPEEGDALVIYTDGASRGNPGPSSTGFVVLDIQGRLIYEGGTKIGKRTNNQAEYMAIKEAVEWADANLGQRHTLHIRSDSELIVKQLSGDWKIKDADLKQLAMATMNALMYFDSFDLTHVPRNENSRADAMANKALDQK